jgi:uncharacterized protein YbjT (DUF2867 family)
MMEPPKNSVALKTANVIGATGLVGTELVRQLLGDSRYGKVRVFVRRTTGIAHHKLDERIVDFDLPDTWSGELQGDEFYSAMGTTIKQAGSKENQYRIDYTYQFETARAAAENGITSCLLVSAAGANPKSRVFYSRIKGELEEAMRALSFSRIAFFQPSLLLGQRDVTRTAERCTEIALKTVDWIPGIRRYRGIPAATVAGAMIAVANQVANELVSVHTLDELFHLASSVS